MTPSGASGGGGADLGGRIRAAARAGELRGVPAGGARVERLGSGESYTAWLVHAGDRARVVRVQRRAAAEMPRPITQEFAAMRRVPPQLGTRALGMDADPGNPLGAPYVVTTYVPGRVLRPRDWGPALLAALAERIARLHIALAEAVGGAGADDGAGPPDAVLRQALEAGAPGDAVPAVVAPAAAPVVAPAAAPVVAPASEQGRGVLAWWRGSAPWTLEHPRVAPLLGAWSSALDRLDAAFEAVPTHPLIHGDLVVTNVVVPDDGLPRFVDFEWAGPGDVAKDLALIGGEVSGGPWYAPMGRRDVLALVEEYARVIAAQAPVGPGAVPGGGAGRWSPAHASATDPGGLLARRDAYELIDRMGNLLYCLSRAETLRQGRAREIREICAPGEAPCERAAPAEAGREAAARYSRWAAEIATGMAAALAQSCRL